MRKFNVILILVTGMVMINPVDSSAQSLKSLLKSVKKTIIGESNDKNAESEKVFESDTQKEIKASSSDEVVLTVSADGTTKEDATKNALRSAIEQTYGTFVSANTSILNDELVKDEIVTISSGNVQEYQEIFSEVMPDGRFFVTLRAKICVSKLVSYAQGKGAKTEFAGASFAMNLKLKEFYKLNEIKALNNLCDQLKLMAPSTFSYKLVVSDPFIAKDAPSILLTSVPRGSGSSEINFSNKFYRAQKFQNLYAGKTIDDFYGAYFIVKIIRNENFLNLTSFMNKSLKAISISKLECDEMRKMNLPVYEYSSSWLGIDLLYFRSPIIDALTKLDYALLEVLHNYEIVDNNGQISTFNTLVLQEPTSPRLWARDPVGLFEFNMNYGSTNSEFMNLFGSFWADNNQPRYGGSEILWNTDDTKLAGHKYRREQNIATFNILLPKEKISEYLSFEIRPKTSPYKIVNKQ